VSLGLPAVAFVLPVLVLVVWTAAVSVFAAVVAAFVRDVPHFVQVALRVGFFGTPVMYEAGFLPSQLAWTAKVNPVAVAITGVRQSLLCSTWPDFPLLAIHLLTGLALLLGAVLYTRSVESRITDVV
jgi:ABC-type polysaccharide/polyol phosphate export permease